jgi:hypothetical protein
VSLSQGHSGEAGGPVMWQVAEQTHEQPASSVQLVEGSVCALSRAIEQG